MTPGQPLEKGPSVLSAAGSGSAPDTPSEALLDAPLSALDAIHQPGLLRRPIGSDGEGRHPVTGSTFSPTAATVFSFRSAMSTRSMRQRKAGARSSACGTA